MTKLKQTLISALLSVTAASAAPAKAFELGDALPAWQLKDQHDKAFSLSQSTQRVLLASSHGAAKLMDEAMKTLPEGRLDALNAVYIADISRVPGLVAKMVLVPSMRSASYRVLLDRQGVVAPERTGAEPVLWLELDGQVISERREFTDAKALRAALEQAAP